MNRFLSFACLALLASSCVVKQPDRQSSGEAHPVQQPLLAIKREGGDLLLRLSPEDCKKRYIIGMSSGMHHYKTPQHVGALVISFQQRGDEVLVLNHDITAHPDWAKQVIARLPVRQKLLNESVYAELSAALLSDIAPFMKKTLEQQASEDDENKLGDQYTWTASCSENQATITAHLPGSPVSTSTTAMSFFLKEAGAVMPVRYVPKSIGFFGGSEAYADWEQPGQGANHPLWRWHLQKKDRQAPVSEVINPICVYLDSEIPDNIRAPFIQGIESWNKAFLAIGLRNVIQVRSSAGINLDEPGIVSVCWGSLENFGGDAGLIADPRSGQIISSRIQVSKWRYEEIFRRPEVELAYPVGSDDSLDPLSAYWHVYWRYLGQHEMGHALGLSHNFRASMWLTDEELQKAGPGRPISASCMDYEAPDFSVDNSSQSGLRALLGPYDYLAIQYAYGDSKQAEEALEIIEKEGIPFSNYLSEIPFDGTTLKWDCSSDPISSAKRAFAAYLDAKTKVGANSVYLNQRLDKIMTNLIAQVGSRSCRNPEGRYQRPSRESQLECLELYLSFLLHPALYPLSNIQAVQFITQLIVTYRSDSLMDACLEGEEDQLLPDEYLSKIARALINVSEIEPSKQATQRKLLTFLLANCTHMSSYWQPLLRDMAISLKASTAQGRQAHPELQKHWGTCDEKIDNFLKSPRQ